MKICREAYNQGVICFYCGHGPFHVRMLPPLLAMKMEDWPRVFECMERATGEGRSQGIRNGEECTDVYRS